MTSVEQGSKIGIEGDRLIIRDFVTREPDIVSYFGDLPESDDMVWRLESLLRVGIVAMKAMGTTSDVKYVEEAFKKLHERMTGNAKLVEKAFVSHDDKMKTNLDYVEKAFVSHDDKMKTNLDYVEKAFEALDEKMKRELETAFGETGSFSDLLKSHFGEDGKIIKDLFNPNREGSPLHMLRADLEGNLVAIRDKLGYNEAVAEEKEKGTQKGFDFETYCEEKLEWIAGIHADKLERTGNTTGKLSRSKKGDFVMTLGDIDKKIVFEMKDRDDISRPDIQRQLNEAMENREAEYGILVAKNKDSLDKSIGWFNEYDGKHLVCALEDGETESVVGGEMIHIAYKWARTRLLAESARETKLDPEFILNKTNEIEKKMKDLRKIKSQCTNIENAAESIRGTVRDTESSVKRDLEEIIDSLGSGAR